MASRQAGRLTREALVSRVKERASEYKWKHKAKRSAGGGR